MDRKFPSNGVVNVPGGVVIRADLFGASSWITHCDRAALAVADPPYGRIVSEKWDQARAAHQRAWLRGLVYFLSTWLTAEPWE